MNTIENGMNVASLNSAYQANQTQASRIEQPQVRTQQEEIDKNAKEQDTKEQKEKLTELAQQLNKEMSGLNTSITFGFSEDIKGLYVTVSERDTNRVIRKIPSDEAMELMAKMREVVGMIFDKQA